MSGQPPDSSPPAGGSAGGRATAEDLASWVDAYGDDLLRYALSRIDDHGTAEDLVQETFLAALKSIARFEGKSSPKTWLTGILRYKILDRYRARGRAKEDFFSDLTDFYQREAEELFGENRHWRGEPGAAPREWRPEQLANLDRQEFWEHFRTCADRLPEKIRLVFILREVDGLDSAEICEQLSITRQNLWTILHRARMALRRCLEETYFAAR